MSLQVVAKKEGFERFQGCLAHRAFKSENSVGRRRQERSPLLRVMDPFLYDLMVIKDSPEHARLRGVMNVFRDPINVFVSIRASHSSGVASHALPILNVTGLNLGLGLAIAEAHDIGHPPFSHEGEYFLAEITQERDGGEFNHDAYNPVVLQEIANAGQGLHLSYEMLEGLYDLHNGCSLLLESVATYQESAAVKIADRFDYTFQDPIDIALRYGLGGREMIEQIASLAGKSAKKSLPDLIEAARTRCYLALFEESAECDVLSFNYSKVAKQFAALRSWLTKNIYQKVDRADLWRMMRAVYNGLAKSPDFADCDSVIIFSRMIDREVMVLSQICEQEELRLKHLEGMAIAEVIPALRGRKINIYKPDLEWGEARVRARRTA